MEVEGGLEGRGVAGWEWEGDKREEKINEYAQNTIFTCMHMP